MTRPDRRRPTAPRPARYAELDGLRGIATLSVVAFHYLTRFDQRFPGYGPSPFGFDLGKYGVHLFFLISGYVILLTVRRSRRPSDFVVSRAARLFPTYHVCLVITLVVTTLAHLPGRVTDPWVIAANFTMVHRLANMASVDGVYWSLAIEVVFYGVMFLAMLRRPVTPERIRTLAVGWAVLGLAVTWLAHATPPDFWLRALRLATISEYAWLFGLGMVLLGSRESGRLDAPVPVVLALGVATQGLVGGWDSAAIVGVIAATFVAVTSVAAVPILRLRPLQFLGAISYPLYLLHQRIGYVILRALIDDVGRIGAVFVALAVATALATVIHHVIEGPASRRVRRVAIRARNRVLGAA